MVESRFDVISVSLPNHISACIKCCHPDSSYCSWILLAHVNGIYFWWENPKVKNFLALVIVNNYSLVIKASTKLLFQEREYMTGPTLFQEACKWFKLCALGGLQATNIVSELLCSREPPTDQDTAKESPVSRWGNARRISPDCSFYMINLIPRIPNPFLLFIKKVGLRWDVKMYFRVHNPLVFNHQHLNKAPIKMQSLSLLICCGRDRQ